MDKYIIFLQDIIVNIKKCFYRCYKYNKLLKSLEKNGIKIISEIDKKNWINKNNNENNIKLSFDYEKELELNKLYICLCGYLGSKRVFVITNNIDLKEQKLSTDIILN